VGIVKVPDAKQAIVWDSRSAVDAHERTDASWRGERPENGVPLEYQIKPGF